MEKRKREETEENDGQTLTLRESGWCLALADVNDLLRCISCDKVPPWRVTCRILASTRSGYPVFNSLNLRQASYDVKARSLCLWHVRGRRS